MSDRMIGVLVILVGSGLLGCSGPTSQSNTRAATNSNTRVSGNDEPKSPPAKAPGPQVTKLTAEELNKEWQADKPGTEKKYAEGLVEVTGTVDRYTIDLAGRPLLLIPCGPDKNKAVVLNVATKQKEPWAVAGPGQQVTVRGKLKKETFDIPYLLEAELVNLGPNTSVEVNAADLAAEGTKDRKGAAEKYKGKGVIVVGKVVRCSPNKSTVFLDGGSKKLVECRMMSAPGVAVGAPLEEGKQARVYGVVSPDADEKDVAVRMNDCLPIIGDTETRK